MSLVFFQLTVFFCIVNLPEIFHYCLYIFCEVGLWITTSECFYWLNKWLKFLYLICRVSQQNVNRKKSKKVLEKLHVLPFCDIFCIFARILSSHWNRVGSANVSVSAQEAVCLLLSFWPNFAPHFRRTKLILLLACRANLVLQELSIQAQLERSVYDVLFERNEQFLLKFFTFLIGVPQMPVVGCVLLVLNSALDYTPDWGLLGVSWPSWGLGLLNAVINESR